MEDGGLVSLSRNLEDQNKPIKEELKMKRKRGYTEIRSPKA